MLHLLSLFILMPLAWSSPSQEALEKVDTAVLSHFEHLSQHSQVAYKCLECHPTTESELARSVHGQAGLLLKLPRGAVCLTCHELNHYVTDSRRVKDFGDPKGHLSSDITCVNCHRDPVITSVYKIKPYVPSSFEQSMHYRKSMLGDRKAPLCADCHGFHSVARVTDSSSIVHGTAQKVKLCSQCHMGANENFASTFNHKPITPKDKPMEYFVILMFKILTLSTFMALGFFMLLDVITLIRHRVFKHQAKPPSRSNRFVIRLNRELRIQHFLMLASVITLVLTSWPLMAPTSPTAQAFAGYLGGARVMAIIHRIAGFVMIGDFLYHIVYLYKRFQMGARNFPMQPRLKDIQDVFAMALYFLGLRPEKPRFDEFAFYEKFDYWAVFWGVAMMGGSGLVLMFPIWVAHVAPGWVISLAAIIHTDEALLAAVVLIIWHFYNVHFKPGIFPMNWAWLTGRMTDTQYEQEHAYHVEKLKKSGKWNPETK